MVLDDNGGWSSGGFLADSVVDGQVNSGTQQQWLSRNDAFGSWTGSNWNMVFVGDTRRAGAELPEPALHHGRLDPGGRARSRSCTSTAPAPTRSSSRRCGPTPAAPPGPAASAPGTSLPISQFYVAKPSDTAATINAALAPRPEPAVHAGRLPPDQHDPGEPGRHRRARPRPGHPRGRQRRRPRCQVADVDGVTHRRPAVRRRHHQLADPAAGRPDRVAAADHSADPTILLRRLRPDRRRRRSARPPVSVQINSNNVIGDDLWLWRADHGNGVGWTSNTAQNGLVVNGDNVTMYGLFVEHYQQYAGALERQRRPHLLLPERAPVRRAEPVQLDERQHPRLRRLQGGRHGHHARGVGPGQLLLLQHQLVGGRRPLVRGAADRRASSSTTW